MCSAPADLEDQAGPAADFDKQGLASTEQVACQLARSLIMCGVEDDARFGDPVFIQEIVAVAAHVPPSNLPKGDSNFSSSGRVKKIGTLLYVFAEQAVSKSALSWPGAIVLPLSARAGASSK